MQRRYGLKMYAGQKIAFCPTEEIMVAVYFNFAIKITQNPKSGLLSLSGLVCSIQMQGALEGLSMERCILFRLFNVKMIFGVFLALGYSE